MYSPGLVLDACTGGPVFHTAIVVHSNDRFEFCRKFTEQELPSIASEGIVDRPRANARWRVVGDEGASSK